MYRNCYPQNHYNKYHTNYHGHYHTIPHVTGEYDEEKKNLTTKIALPGIKKEDIQIKASSRKLSVKAVTKETEKVKTEEGNEETKEVEKVVFNRNVMFRHKINTQNIKAKLENGILTLEIAFIEPEIFDVNIE